MRAPILLLFSLAVHVCAAGARGESPFPYLAYVAGEQAPLFSGPGQDYYETSHVAQGSAVEVWRSAPEGWLAIRPPRGSYSLVAATDVRVRPDRVAEVVRPEAPCRVGSEVSARSDVIQVSLAPGEKLQVLETITLDGQFWHKVAPPSGEFRWIHASHVVGPPTPVPSAPPGSPEQLQAEDPEASIDPAAGGLETRPDARFDALEAEPIADPADSSLNPPEAGRSLADSESGRQTGLDAITVAQIELEVATIVAEESRLWHFAHLRRRCQELIASAPSELEQKDVAALLEKIKRFERIADQRRKWLSGQRQSGNASGAATPARDLRAAELEEKTGRDAGAIAENETHWRPAREETGETLAADRSSPGREVVRVPDQPVEPDPDEGRYDGVGTLRPVVSRRREAPRYALVDTEGDVISFVTPSPGVNLEPYVGQRIGVVGTRGYMPEFKVTIVPGARVTPLG
jgi:hypothetical protein